MKEQNKMSKYNLVIAYLSFFYTGFIPKAPGTFGSLATIPFIFLITKLKLSLTIFSVLLLFLIILTCLITNHVQKRLKLHDPQWIVIDEVLGMLTAWAFIYPDTNYYYIFMLFLLFRFFDIIKFWPASYFDKMTHGAGTILDDIVSGIFTGIILLIGKIFL